MVLFLSLAKLSKSTVIKSYSYENRILKGKWSRLIILEFWKSAAPRTIPGKGGQVSIMPVFNLAFFKITFDFSGHLVIL